jgi:hypothetical protein
MKVAYAVDMIDPHCPSERIDCGLFETLEKAGKFIEKERVQYSERMEWEVTEHIYHDGDQ